MKLSASYVILDDQGAVEQYVFLDPEQFTQFYNPARRGYEHAVSFSAPGMGDPSRNYPVVFDDLTTKDGEQLWPIDGKTVPSGIKRKLAAWSKRQVG